MPLLFLSSLALAGPSCDDLRLDLLALEYKIHMSKLDMCSDENPRFCQIEGSRDFDTKYYNEIEAEYNKALAELIIAEGLVAISNSIAGSYNSVAAINESIDGLDQESLSNIHSYFKVLEDNTDKAVILEAAMTPVAHASSDSNVSFARKYNIPRDMSFERFNDRMRSLCSNEAKDEALCKSLIAHGDSPAINLPKEINEEHLETVHGFIMADIRARASDPTSDPESYYDQFKQYLKIKVGPNKIVSATEFKNNYLENGSDGRPSMRTYEATFNNYNEARSENTAKTLIDMAVKMDSVDVSYDKIVDANNSPSTLAPAMQDFLHKELAAPLDALKIDPTDQIITNIWKKNLNNQIQNLKNQANILTKGKEKATLRGIGEAEAQGAIGGISSDKANLLNESANKLELALACFDKKTLDGNDGKKKCIEDLENQFPVKGNLSELREKVKIARDNLNFFNVAKPIKQLKVMKGLAIRALESKPDCSEKVSTQKHFCRQDLEMETSPQFLDLSDTISDVRIKLDEQWATSQYNLNADHRFNEFRLKRDQFMNEECSENGSVTLAGLDPDYYQNICRYYQAEQSAREEAAQEIRERQRAEEQRRNRIAMSRKYQLKDDRPSKAGIIAKSMTGVLVNSLPQLITTKVEYDQTKQWRNYSLQSIQYREQAYDNYLSELRGCQSDPVNGCSSFRYQMAMNHGMGMMGAGYYNQSNFQSGYTGNVYSNSPYNFNFATSVDTGLLNNNNAFPTTPTSGTTEYNFSF